MYLQKYYSILPVFRSSNKMYRQNSMRLHHNPKYTLYYFDTLQNNDSIPCHLLYCVQVP